MYKNKKILAIIPARGGSKGIKDKNIIDVNGKPLIWYTINAAKESEYIDDIFVSTDSEKIRSVAVEYGVEVPFLRSKQNAGDTAKTIDAVVETIENFGKLNKYYDYIVLLQPTSPLRTFMDIDESITKIIDVNGVSLVSVCEAELNPIFIRKIEQNKLKRIINVDSTVRRQDLEKFYRLNGAIYINNTEFLNNETSLNDNEIPYIMTQGNSVDIDDYNDLVRIRNILKNRI